MRRTCRWLRALCGLVLAVAPLAATPLAAQDPDGVFAGPIEFAGTAWGSSLDQVRQHLEPEGFTLEQQGGDTATFRGALLDRPALVKAVFQQGALFAFHILLQGRTPDATLALFAELNQVMTRRYGPMGTTNAGVRSYMWLGQRPEGMDMLTVTPLPTRGLVLVVYGGYNDPAGAEDSPPAETTRREKLF